MCHIFKKFSRNNRRDIFHSVVKIVRSRKSLQNRNRATIPLCSTSSRIVVSRIRNKMEIGETSNGWFV